MLRSADIRHSAFVLAATCPAATPTSRPAGTLTVAVATFGNERWLPHSYVAAEDIVRKPMVENLLSHTTDKGGRGRYADTV
jgi:hypothetical protein